MLHLSALLYSHIFFTPRHPSWLQGGCQSAIHNMFIPVQTGRKPSSPDEPLSLKHQPIQISSSLIGQNHVT